MKKSKIDLLLLVLSVIAVFMIYLYGGITASDGGIKIAYSEDVTAEEADKSLQVNINTADAETLQTLEGIGKKTAENIIRHRKKYSGFSDIYELLDIKGIGEKTFDRIKDQITV